jgi:hypothetical protein
LLQYYLYWLFFYYANVDVSNVSINARNVDVRNASDMNMRNASDMNVRDLSDLRSGLAILFGSPQPLP